MAEQVAFEVLIDFSKLEKYTSQVGKTRAAQKLFRDELRKQQNIVLSQENSYRGLSTRLNLLRNNYKDLAVQNKANTKEGRALLKNITELDARLKGIDAKVGQFQRNVGNYSSAFKNLGKNILGAFGVTGAVTLFANAVRGAFQNVVKFDQASANLASILGKSKDEITDLTDNAKELGATTAFSATQVLELQTELAKLGFTSEEIIESAKAVEDFSIAVGTDAASAASVAGAALRSFNLDASQMERVVSTLSVATTKSALDFQKIQTAIGVVAPVASAANVSIERTTALLGVLSDRGLDASTAGTSLRNIFLELSKQGISWNDAMTKINSSTDKLNAANELFGKRGATAALILADNEDAAIGLEEAITGVNDELAVMVDERLDTVSGQLTLLKSAWEGFTLSIEDGDGVLSDVFKGAIDGFNGILTALTQLNEGGVSFKNFLFLAFGDSDVRQVVIRDLEKLREVQGRLLDSQKDEYENLFNEQYSLLTRRKELTEEIKRLEERDTSGFLSPVKQAATNEAIRQYKTELDEIITKLNKIEDFENPIVAGGTRGIGGLSEETRIQSLKDQIESYRKSLEEAANGSDEYNQIVEDIKFTQNALKELQNEANNTEGAFDEIIPENSIKGLKEKISAINKEIDTATSPEIITELVIDRQKLEKQLKELESIAKPKILVNPNSLEGLRNQISEINKAIQGETEESKILKNIEKLIEAETKLQELENRIDATRNRIEDPDRKVNEIQQIERLETPSSIDAVVSNEDLILEVQKANADELKEYKEQKLEEYTQSEIEAAQSIVELRKEIASALEFASSNLFNIQRTKIESNLNKELESIDLKYSKEIEAAQGNEALQSKLREQKEKSEAEAERRAGRRRKDQARKEAIIEGAIAVIRALPNPITVAYAIAQTGFQIAAINSQTFDGGGKIDPYAVKDSSKAIFQRKYKPGDFSFPAEKGGIIKGPPHELGGVKFKVKGKPDYLGEARGNELIMNEVQQNRARNLFGDDVFGKIGVPGFKMPKQSPLKQTFFEDGGLIAAASRPPAAPVGFIESRMETFLGQETIDQIGEAVARGSQKGIENGMNAANEQAVLLESLKNETQI